MFNLKRIYTIFFHVCFWCVLFACMLLWRPQMRGPLTGLQIILGGLPFIGLYYLNAYLLIPNFLSRKEISVYILYAILAGASVMALSGWGLHLGASGPMYERPFFGFRRIVPTLFFLMASASVGAFKENFRLEKYRKEKETEHLRTELAFLRAQVNPHFMLNVLNSMVLLARRKSDLEPVLMELAGLMNYMLYNANSEKIRLEDEILYLKAYIDLQMLRFRDDVRLEFNAPAMGGVTEKYIEPMLLIPLVENAFKHGIGLVKDPVIYIDLRADQDRKVSLTVENKFNRLIQQQEGRAPGIGLKNLKKRLELIYPGEFTFNISTNHHADAVTDEDWYNATLNIPLQ